MMGEKKVRIEKAFLFGSYARGDANDDSDIDVAVLSPDFEGVRFSDKQKLNIALAQLDSRLEIHPYRSDEFNRSNWFVQEILLVGIPIFPVR
jgi:predicted nucleotidyltransferase